MRLLVTILFIMSISKSTFAQRYLFYLHGRIIEEQGAHAVDTVNGFGAYDYEGILNVFRTKGFSVLSEVREKNTDPAAYAKKIVLQIDSLMNAGTSAANITIVGASKGSIIAMLVSSYLKNASVNFVLLAGCNKDVLKEFPDIHFCGNILSIYENSDDIGRSCASFKKGSHPDIPHYKEIELHTGLRHGFLYKPLPVWIEPAIAWANNDYR